ncbi:MAG: hypothetical protein EOP06_03160, partial [Proteobacteria bacterium]
MKHKQDLAVRYKSALGRASDVCGQIEETLRSDFRSSRITCEVLSSPSDDPSEREDRIEDGIFITLRLTISLSGLSGDTASDISSLLASKEGLLLLDPSLSDGGRGVDYGLYISEGEMDRGDQHLTLQNVSRDFAQIMQRLIDQNLMAKLWAAPRSD